MEERIWVLRVADEVIAAYTDEAAALAGLMSEPQAVLVPVTVTDADRSSVSGLHIYTVRFAPDGAVRSLEYGGPHDDDDPIEPWRTVYHVAIETAATSITEIIEEARRYWQGATP